MGGFTAYLQVSEKTKHGTKRYRIYTHIISLTREDAKLDGERLKQEFLEVNSI